MNTDWSWLRTLSSAEPVFTAFAAQKRKRPPIGTPPSIPNVVLALRQWDGEVGPWEEHFGKGRKQAYPTIGSDPYPSCAEVEVVKLLRGTCKQAYWVSCFNAEKLPARWRPYALAFRELPAWLRSVDDDIRTRIQSAAGGIPDAVGWDEEDPKASARFVECKAVGESIKESQQDWVTDAIAHHLSNTIRRRY